MVMLTSLFGALIGFSAMYMFAQYCQRNYGLKADVARRLQKFKDETAAQTKKAAPRRVALTLADIPFLDRTIKPLIESIKQKLLSFAPTDISTMLERRIMLAGKQGVWHVNQCVMAWIGSIVACSIIAFLMIDPSADLVWIQKLSTVLIGSMVGAMLPFAVLSRIIRERHKLIRRQLPEFLDLLCVSVQAGLSFEGSVSKITSRMKGPLIDEFKQMQRDGAMGIPRRLSLQQMAKRCDIEELYLFTASVIQSERLGTSMAKTLAVQAANMRERHRQRVRSDAMKAPVKIIFPLVIFILPAIFIVTLLPIIFTTIQNFKM